MLRPVLKALVFMLACIAILNFFDNVSAQVKKSTKKYDRSPTDNKPKMIVGLEHSSIVTAVAYSPNGRLIATASNDNTARLWDAVTGQELRQFIHVYTLPLFGSRNVGVRCIAFSPDSRLIATGDMSGTVHLWDVATGKKVWSFLAHVDMSVITKESAMIASLAFSPDGRYLVTAGGIEKTACLWNVAQRYDKPVRSFKGHVGLVTAVAFSPDARFILTGSFTKEGEVPDSTTRLWSVATGKEIRRFEGNSNAIFSVAFSLDGRYVLTGSLDSTARMWDAQTGIELRRFVGHSSPIWSVGFTPDARFVLTGSGDSRDADNTLRVWDVITAREVRRFEGHSDMIFSLACSPDGNYVVTGSADNSVRIWDISIKDGLHYSPGHLNAITAITYSKDGRFVLTGSMDKTAILWDAATGKSIRAFSGHSQSIESVEISLDNRFILTIEGINKNRFIVDKEGFLLEPQRKAILWEVSTGEQVRQFDDWYYATFVLQGSYVMLESRSGISSRQGKGSLWHIYTRKEVPIEVNQNTLFKISPYGRAILTGRNNSASLSMSPSDIKHLEGHTNTIQSAVFSPDDTFLLTMDTGGTAILWNTATKKEERRFENCYDGVISAKGQYILTKDKKDEATLWGSASTPQMRRLQGIDTVIFSPDASLMFVKDIARNIVLYETSTGKEIKRFENHGRGRFSPDSNYLALTDFRQEDKWITLIWDIRAGREIRRFDGLPFFSPDSRVLLTRLKGDFEVADGDGLLSDLATGREIRRFYEKVPIVFSRDGSFVLTAAGRIAQLLDSNTGQEASRFEGDSNKELRRLEGNVRQVSKVRFSSDGRYLIVVTSNSEDRLSETHVWDRDTGREIELNKGNPPEVAPGRSRLDIKKEGKGVILFDSSTNQDIRRYRYDHEAKFSISPDGRTVFVPESRANEPALLIDKITGKMTELIPWHKGNWHLARFSPDGRFLITGGSPDNPAALWEVATGKQLQHFEGYHSIWNAAFFSHDGHYIFTGEGVGGTGFVRQWDLITGKEVKRYNTTRMEPESIESSPDGQFIAALNQGAVDVWNTSNGEQVILESTGFLDIVTSFKFSTDNRFILIGYVTGVVRLLSLATGGEVRQLKGHSGGINLDVTFSPDGRFIVTGGADGTTRIWDKETGEELCRLISFRDRTWVTITPDGFFDASSLEEINGLHWVMPDDPLKPIPLHIFTRDYYKPRLLSLILKGERFKSVRTLANLNRAQPIVKITRIEQHKSHPELVDVTVEALEGKSESQKSKQGLPRKSGIYDLRLFRDGQLVAYEPRSSTNIQSYLQLGNQASFDDELKVWCSIAEFKPDPKTGNTRTFTVRLPKNRDITEVQFSAYAFNDERVKSETFRETYKLPQPLKAFAKGRAYLITIGVAASENPQWNLFYPANDARRMLKDIYERLSRQYDEVVRLPLVSDFGGIVKRYGDCVEKRPTREAIKTVLDLLAGRDVDPQRRQLVPCAEQIQKAQPEDLVLISFSGHGYGDGQGNYYLFPYDIGKMRQGQQITDTLPDELLSRLISSEELSAWMRDVDAGDIVMILDACQSEAATGKEFKPGPMGSRGLGQLAYDKGMRMIVATQADNQAIGVGSLSHGLLIYALTKEGLEDSNIQSLSVKEWLGRAAERVPRLYDERVPEEVKKFGKLQQPAIFDFARTKAQVLLVKGN